MIGFLQKKQSRCPTKNWSSLIKEEKERTRQLYRSRSTKRSMEPRQTYSTPVIDVLGFSKDSLTLISKILNLVFVPPMSAEMKVYQVGRRIRNAQFVLHRYTGIKCHKAVTESVDSKCTSRIACNCEKKWLS